MIDTNVSSHLVDIPFELRLLEIFLGRISVKDIKVHLFFFCFVSFHLKWWKWHDNVWSF